VEKDRAPAWAGACRVGRASAVGLSEAFSQTIGIGRLSDSPVVNPPVGVRACRGSAASTAGRLFVDTLAKNSGELVVAAAIRLACHLGHVTSIPDFSWQLAPKFSVTSRQRLRQMLKRRSDDVTKSRQFVRLLSVCCDGDTVGNDVKRNLIIGLIWYHECAQILLLWIFHGATAPVLRNVLKATSIIPGSGPPWSANEHGGACVLAATRHDDRCQAAGGGFFQRPKTGPRRTPRRSGNLIRDMMALATRRHQGRDRLARIAAMVLSKWAGRHDDGRYVFAMTVSANLVTRRLQLRNLFSREIERLRKG
jgi:hypothetical protein